VENGSISDGGFPLKGESLICEREEIYLKMERNFPQKRKEVPWI